MPPKLPSRKQPGSRQPYPAQLRQGHPPPRTPLGIWPPMPFMGYGPRSPMDMSSKIVEKEINMPMDPPGRRRNDSHDSGTERQGNDDKSDYEKDPRAWQNYPVPPHPGQFDRHLPFYDDKIYPDYYRGFLEYERREQEKKESGKEKRNRSFSGDYEKDEDLDRPTKEQETKQPVIQKDPFDDTPDKESKYDRATAPSLMMASNSSHCESCSEEGKSIEAIQFCSDCEEHLCKECVEYHKKCKATKSHHLMDLASMLRLKIPNIKKFCIIHEDVSLDFYCTQHDTVCCRKCIPSKHQSCKDVLPLEVASELIKKSSLFEDTFSEWQNIGKILDHLKKDRNDNINELEKSESAICKEVRDWKSNLIKQINTFEDKIKVDLSNLKTRNLDELKKQNDEISELHENVQEREQELEFLKEHGSNSQLFRMLREHGKGVQNAVKRVQEMTRSYKRVYLKFENRTDIDIKSIGSISVCKEARDVPYSPVKFQQAQVQPERVEAILTFKKEITEQLQPTDKLHITDLAVTADDTLFLCNYASGVRKIYVYRTNLKDIIYVNKLSLPSEPYCISVFKGREKAVVSLPSKSYVQFINTKSLTLDKTIAVGGYCYGITTSGENFVVGRSTEISIFKENGECIKNIFLNDELTYEVVSSLHYNQNDNRIICKKLGQICSIQTDGTVAYHYAVSGSACLAVDAQGHVYVSEVYKNEIHRLIPDGRFRDVVLTEKDGIEKPFAMAFNDSFTKFYVTNNKGLLQVYNCT